MAINRRLTLPTKSLSYLRNVGRSLGYAVADVARDNNQYVISLFKDSKEVVQETYSTVKDWFSEKSDINIFDTGKSIVGDIKKNFFDDIKSGDWYNKERDQVYEDNLSKMMGFDFGDFDLDFDDFGDDSDDSLSNESKAAISQDVKNTQATIMAIDETGRKISSAVNKGTAASADYIVSASRSMNQALYNLNKNGFGTVTSAIANLNKNTTNMIESIGKPLTSHIQNSALFFSKTTESLNKMEQSLAQIVKNTTPAQVAGRTGNTKNDKSIANMLGSDGIDINAYLEFVKGNIKEWTDIISMFTGGSTGKAGGNLKNFGKGISPLRWLPKMIVNNIIPEAFKDAQKEFNEGLKTFLTGALVKGNKSARKKGGIIGFLSDLLLPEDELKTTLQTNKYNKGPVAWDGVARKALVEVIPTTLFKIYSAITGADGFTYDYNAGKFVTTRSITDKKEERFKSTYRRASGQLYNDAMRRAGNDKKTQESLEEFFRYAFTNNDDYFNILQPRFNKTELYKKLTPEAVAILRNLIGGSRNSKGRRGVYNSFIADITKGRNDYSNTLRELEAAGIDTELSLYNNSDTVFKGGKLGRFVDEFNHDSLFYLRGIYENTLGGGYGNKKRKKGGKNTAHERTKAEANAQIMTSSEEADTILFFRDGREVDQTSEEEMRKYKRELRSQEAVDYFEEIQDDINERVDQTWIGKLRSKTKNLFIKPINAVTKLLNTLTDSMTSLLWGDGKTDKGLFGKIKDKASEMFDKIISDPMKNLFNKLFGVKDEDGKRSGGALSGFWNDTKNTLGDYWKWMGTAIREPILQAFNGRKVTKTGLIAASAGEMIIPSELNPYFHGTSDKNQQRRRENQSIRNFYGAYAGGTTNVGSERESETSGSDRGSTDRGSADEDAAAAGKLKNIEAIRRQIAKGGKNRDMALSVIANGQDNKDKVTFDGVKYVKYSDGHWGEANFQAGSIGAAFSNAGKMISEKAKDFATSMFGDESKKEEVGNKIDKLTESLVPELGKSKGRIGAGAIIGALGGGILGGPLLGMTLGAAAGFVSKSEKAQEMLFGPKDESGNRSGGLINKNISNFLEKHAPEMLKFGSVGALAGTLFGPVGLVGGLLLGSATGYVKTSKKAQEAIFGKLGEDGKREGGVIPKEIQERFKKSKGAMLAGAGIGLLAGPFGLFGNLAVGAGLGFISENEKVHRFLFGGEDKNGKKKEGLLPKIGDKIFGSINDIFHNIGNRIKNWLKDTGIGIKKRLSKLVSRIQRNAAKNEALQRVRQSPLTKVLKGVGKGLGLGTLGLLFGPAGALALGAGGLALNLPSFISGKIRKGNAASGNDIYGAIKDEQGNYILDENGKKIKRNFTAEERIRYRKNDMHVYLNPKKNVTALKWNKFDEHISKLDKQGLNELKAELANYTEDDNAATKIAKNKALEEFYNGCDQKINDLQMKKLAGYIMDGDYRGAERYITDTLASRDNFTEEDINHYIELVSKCIKIVQDAEKQHRDTKKKLRELGLNFKNIGRAEGLIDTELKSERMSHEEVMEKYTADQTTDIHEILEILKDPEGYRTRQREEREKDIDAKWADRLNDPNYKPDDTYNVEEGTVRKSEKGYCYKMENGKWKRISKSQYQVEVATQQSQESLSKLSKVASEGPIFKDAEKVKAAASLKLTYNGGNTAYGLDSQNDRIQFKWDGKTWIKDDKDKATRDETERADTAEQSSIKAAEALDNINASIAGGFFSNSDEKSESGEKKESLLDKIMNFGSKIFGEGGILSGLLDKVTTGIFGAGGLLAGLFKSTLTPLLIGSFITDVWTKYLEYTGATKDQVEHAKTDGSLITAGATAAFAGKAAAGALTKAGLTGAASVVGAFTPAVVAAAAGGALLYELSDSATDVEQFDSGRTAVAQEKESTSNKTIKVTQTDSRTRKTTTVEYPAFFNSVTEFLNYCKSTPDAKRYYTNNPGSIVVYVTDSTGNKIDVVDGYPLLYPAKLTSDGYHSCNFRGYKCWYYVTKDSDEIKELVPNAGKRGILNRDIAIRSVVLKSNNDIIVGTTWGNTSLTFGEDNTHWSHTYTLINMSTGVGSSISYRQDEALVYILMAGGFYEGNKEEQFNQGATSIMNYIDKTLGENNGCAYFRYLGGKEEYTDIATRKKYSSASQATWDGSIKYIDYAGHEQTIQEGTSSSHVSGGGGEYGGGGRARGSGLLTKLAGKASGFISQIDPKYANMTYGNSTVGQAGCAPATATMISKYYGKSLSMNNAVAEGEKYTNQNGTSTGYFKDILGKQGINTAYVAGSDIGASLASGHPVALIGKDPSNMSKKTSPFGPDNHYVMAQGFDSNGNVIINDPEMGHTTKYNPSILNSATLGISTSLAGKATGSKYITNISDFYSGMKKITYSDGTIEVVDKNSDKLKGGVGSYVGTSTDVFKGRTPIKVEDYYGGTRRITYSDGTVEVVGKDSDTAKAAESIYKNTYENYALNTQQASNTTSSSSTAVESETSATTTEDQGTFLEKLYGFFSKLFTGATSALGKWFAGGKQKGSLINYIDDEILNLNSSTGTYANIDYNSDDYKKYMSSVPGGNDKQKELVAKMKSIEKGSNYSQTGPRDPSKGSADCSSTVNWVYKKVLGVDIGNNTDAMINSDKTVPIDNPSGNPIKYASGGYAPVTNSPGPNLSRLEPGDILLYSNSKGVNKDRKYQVSHVEMYMGDDTTMGHTGSPGPTSKTASTYRSKQYIMARRLANIRDYDSGASAKYITNISDFYSGMKKITYSDGTIEVVDKNSDKLKGGKFYNTITAKGSGIANKLNGSLFGSSNSRSNVSRPIVSSNMVNSSTINTNTIRRRNTSNSDELLTQLVGALVNLISDMSNGRGTLSENVSKIANNSDNLAKIAEMVNMAKEAANTRTNTKPAQSSKKVYNGLEGDSNFRSTVSQVAAWAKG